MPTTVTASNGNTYHLFQLSTETSVKTFEESIGFTTLRNKLSDGYRAKALLGSNTGVRRWRLTLPTLAHSTVPMPTVTGVNGETVSREEYLWDLYCETQITGEPFVIQSERNGQYYLVDFVDERLSYEGMKVKLYSTGVELEQVRIDGVTVFDVMKMPVTGFGYNWYNETSHGAGVWNDLNPLSISDFTVTGDVTFGAATQNGLDIVRFSSSTNDGVLNTSSFSQPFFDLFLVMKMREAAFSNNAGIVTASAGDAILVGDDTTTKFQNLVGADDEYFLNATEYLHTDMQAPMNEWGIVQLRSRSGGFDPANIQIGKNAGIAGTFAELDVAEIVSFAQPVPRNQTRELLEHLTVKWGIT